MQIALKISKIWDEASDGILFASVSFHLNI